MRDSEFVCWSGNHWTALILLAMPMFILALLLPLLAACVPHANRSKNGGELEATFTATSACFTVKGYKDNRFFWEVVVFARKICLVGLVVLTGHPHWQTLVANIVLAAALAVHCLLWPFQNKKANLAELASLVISQLNVFFVLYFFFREDLSATPQRLSLRSSSQPTLPSSALWSF